MEDAEDVSRATERAVDAMSTRSRTVRRWPVLAVALTLVLCAASGLAAGSFTREVVDAFGRPDGVAGIAASPTHHATHTATPSPSATRVPTVLAASGFSLSTVVTPNQLTPGQQFTVVVTAVARDGVTPVSGLQCFLQAPSNGRLPLFTEWPSPTGTDATGHATWTLMAPPDAPGRYGIEVIAYGDNHYWYHSDPQITVVAG
jgi:hypothetical protein